MAPTSSSAWFPVSAIEWIASASIDVEAVSSQANSLVTAIPRLASKAATTAVLPDCADTVSPR